eukprot:TRINITY_DN8631_c0_g2_i1.p1 TRINITY_DN8631_c0_g2~~TRINITY_DN8631_c0_g2_i1.p1  ORF type:complete len:222 (+),score=58.01 TRINITY_DN8631_c0_g2_i1:624-1289(+)
MKGMGINKNQNIQKKKFPVCLDYFMNSLDRLEQNEYSVNHEDILHARTKTTGIHFFEIPPSAHGQPSLCFIDVGGQKSERRKWAHAFDDVSSVIYISALDNFDRVLEEDPTRNRLEDDLDLFSKVILSPFLPPNWIFFQNKCDIFAKKVEDKTFFNTHPQLGEKAMDYKLAVLWLREQFQDLVPQEKKVTFHVTCALDEKKTKKILDSIRGDLIQTAISVF